MADALEVRPWERFQSLGDHPYSDPGDGKSLECQTCGKWVRLVTHSCKGVPVTEAAWLRAVGPALSTGEAPLEKGGFPVVPDA